MRSWLLSCASSHGPGVALIDRTGGTEFETRGGGSRYAWVMKNSAVSQRPCPATKKRNTCAGLIVDPLHDNGARLTHFPNQRNSPIADFFLYSGGLRCRLPCLYQVASCTTRKAPVRPSVCRSGAAVGWIKRAVNHCVDLVPTASPAVQLLPVPSKTVRCSRVHPAYGAGLSQHTADVSAVFIELRVYPPLRVARDADAAAERALSAPSYLMASVGQATSCGRVDSLATLGSGALGRLSKTQT